MGEHEDVGDALRRLTDAMLSDLESRARFTAAVSKLETTVSRFVVAMERSLASNEAVQRKAERVLKGVDPAKIAAMNDQLDRVYRRK